MSSQPAQPQQYRFTVPEIYKSNTSIPSCPHNVSEQRPFQHSQTSSSQSKPPIALPRPSLSSHLTSGFQTTHDQSNTLPGVYLPNFSTPHPHTTFLHTNPNHISTNPSIPTKPVNLPTNSNFPFLPAQEHPTNAINTEYLQRSYEKWDVFRIYQTLLYTYIECKSSNTHHLQLLRISRFPTSLYDLEIDSINDKILLGLLNQAPPSVMGQCDHFDLVNGEKRSKFSKSPNDSKVSKNGFSSLAPGTQGYLGEADIEVREEGLDLTPRSPRNARNTTSLPTTLSSIPNPFQKVKPNYSDPSLPTVKLVASGVALMGFIRFELGFYLQIVVSSESIGSIGSHDIHQINTVQLIQLFSQDAVFTCDTITTPVQHSYSPTILHSPFAPLYIPPTLLPLASNQLDKTNNYPANNAAFQHIQQTHQTPHHPQSTTPLSNRHASFSSKGSPRSTQQQQPLNPQLQHNISNLSNQQFPSTPSSKLQSPSAAHTSIPTLVQGEPMAVVNEYGVNLLGASNSLYSHSQQTPSALTLRDKDYNKEPTISTQTTTQIDPIIGDWVYSSLQRYQREHQHYIQSTSTRAFRGFLEEQAGMLSAGVNYNSLNNHTYNHLHLHSSHSPDIDQQRQQQPSSPCSNFTPTLTNLNQNHLQNPQNSAQTPYKSQSPENTLALYSQTQLAQSNTLLNNLQTQHLFDNLKFRVNNQLNQYNHYKRPHLFSNINTMMVPPLLTNPLSNTFSPSQHPSLPSLNEFQYLAQRLPLLPITQAQLLSTGTTMNQLPKSQDLLIIQYKLFVHRYNVLTMMYKHITAMLIQYHQQQQSLTQFDANSTSLEDVVEENEGDFSDQGEISVYGQNTLNSKTTNNSSKNGQNTKGRNNQNLSTSATSERVARKPSFWGSLFSSNTDRSSVTTVKGTQGGQSGSSSGAVSQTPTKTSQNNQNVSLFPRTTSRSTLFALPNPQNNPRGISGSFGGDVLINQNDLPTYFPTLHSITLNPHQFAYDFFHETPAQLHQFLPPVEGHIVQMWGNSENHSNSCNTAGSTNGLDNHDQSSALNRQLSNESSNNALKNESPSATSTSLTLSSHPNSTSHHHSTTANTQTDASSSNPTDISSTVEVNTDSTSNPTSNSTSASSPTKSTSQFSQPNAQPTQQQQQQQIPNQSQFVDASPLSLYLTLSFHPTTTSILATETKWRETYELMFTSSITNAGSNTTAATTTSTTSSQSGIITTSKDFYFSHTYPITHTLQTVLSTYRNLTMLASQDEQITILCDELNIDNDPYAPNLYKDIKKDEQRAELQKRREMGEKRRKSQVLSTLSSNSSDGSDFSTFDLQLDEDGELIRNVGLSGTGGSVSSDTTQTDLPLQTATQTQTDFKIKPKLTIYQSNIYKLFQIPPNFHFTFNSNLLQPIYDCLSRALYIDHNNPLPTPDVNFTTKVAEKVQRMMQKLQTEQNAPNAPNAQNLNQDGQKSRHPGNLPSDGVDPLTFDDYDGHDCADLDGSSGHRDQQHGFDQLSQFPSNSSQTLPVNDEVNLNNHFNALQVAGHNTENTHHDPSEIDDLSKKTPPTAPIGPIIHSHQPDLESFLPFPSEQPTTNSMVLSTHSLMKLFVPIIQGFCESATLPVSTTTTTTTTTTVTVDAKGGHVDLKAALAQYDQTGEFVPISAQTSSSTALTESPADHTTHMHAGHVSSADSAENVVKTPTHGLSDFMLSPPSQFRSISQPTSSTSPKSTTVVSLLNNTENAQSSRKPVQNSQQTANPTQIPHYTLLDDVSRQVEHLDKQKQLIEFKDSEQLRLKALDEANMASLEKQQKTLTTTKTTAETTVSEQNLLISPRLIVLGRRSAKFAGTRYLKRGISNTHGNPANEVETEQIVGFNGQFTSYVHLRGSIPLFWSQSNTKSIVAKPDIEITDPDLLQFGPQKYWSKLLTRYGSNIIVINLIKHYEKNPRESLIGAHLSRQIEELQALRHINNGIIHVALDYKAILKSSVSAVDTLGLVTMLGVLKTGIFNASPTIETVVKQPGRYDGFALTKFVGNNFNPTDPRPSTTLYPSALGPISALALPSQSTHENAINGAGSHIGPQQQHRHQYNNSFGTPFSPTHPSPHLLPSFTTSHKPPPKVFTNAIKNMGFRDKDTLFNFCTSLTDPRSLSIQNKSHLQESTDLQAIVGSLQHGVIRVNCIDSIDRSNVGQFMISKIALSAQLQHLLIPSSITSQTTSSIETKVAPTQSSSITSSRSTSSNPSPEQQVTTVTTITSSHLSPSISTITILLQMYEKMGDCIALQYGGSQMHRQMRKESGKSQTMTPVLYRQKQQQQQQEALRKHNQSLFRGLVGSAGGREILISVYRHYQNSFNDKYKQDVINVFLGLYKSYSISANLGNSVWWVNSNLRTDDERLDAVLWKSVQSQSGLNSGPQAVTGYQNATYPLDSVDLLLPSLHNMILMPNSLFLSQTQTACTQALSNHPNFPHLPQLQSSLTPTGQFGVNFLTPNNNEGNLIPFLPPTPNTVHYKLPRVFASQTGQFDKTTINPNISRSLTPSTAQSATPNAFPLNINHRRAPSLNVISVGPMSMDSANADVDSQGDPDRDRHSFHQTVHNCPSLNQQQYNRATTPHHGQGRSMLVLNENIPGTVIGNGNVMSNTHNPPNKPNYNATNLVSSYRSPSSYVPTSSFVPSGSYVPQQQSVYQQQQVHPDRVTSANPPRGDDQALNRHSLVFSAQQQQQMLNIANQAHKFPPTSPTHSMLRGGQHLSSHGTLPGLTEPSACTFRKQAISQTNFHNFYVANAPFMIGGVEYTHDTPFPAIDVNLNPNTQAIFAQNNTNNQFLIPNRLFLLWVLRLMIQQYRYNQVQQEYLEHVQMETIAYGLEKTELSLRYAKLRLAHQDRHDVEQIEGSSRRSVQDGMKKDSNLVEADGVLGIDGLNWDDAKLTYVYDGNGDVGVMSVDCIRDISTELQQNALFPDPSDPYAPLKVTLIPFESVFMQTRSMMALLNSQRISGGFDPSDLSNNLSNNSPVDHSYACYPSVRCSCPGPAIPSNIDPLASQTNQNQQQQQQQIQFQNFIVQQQQLHQQQQQQMQRWGVDGDGQNSQFSPGSLEQHFAWIHQYQQQFMPQGQLDNDWLLHNTALSTSQCYFGRLQANRAKLHSATALTHFGPQHKAGYVEYDGNTVMIDNVNVVDNLVDMNSIKIDYNSTGSNSNGGQQQQPHSLSSRRNGMFALNDNTFVDPNAEQQSGGKNAAIDVGIGNTDSTFANNDDSSGKQSEGQNGDAAVATAPTAMGLSKTDSAPSNLPQFINQRKLHVDTECGNEDGEADETHVTASESVLNSSSGSNQNNNNNNNTNANTNNARSLLGQQFDMRKLITQGTTASRQQTQSNATVTFSESSTFPQPTQQSSNLSTTQQFNESNQSNQSPQTSLSRLRSSSNLTTNPQTLAIQSIIAHQITFINTFNFDQYLCDNHTVNKNWVTDSQLLFEQRLPFNSIAIHTSHEATGLPIVSNNNNWDSGFNTNNPDHLLPTFSSSDSILSTLSHPTSTFSASHLSTSAYNPRLTSTKQHKIDIDTFGLLHLWSEISLPLLLLSSQLVAQNQNQNQNPDTFTLPTSTSSPPAHDPDPDTLHPGQSGHNAAHLDTQSQGQISTDHSIARHSAETRNLGLPNMLTNHTNYTTTATTPQLTYSALLNLHQTHTNHALSSVPHNFCARCCSYEPYFGYTTIISFIYHQQQRLLSFLGYYKYLKSIVIQFKTYCHKLSQITPQHKGAPYHIFSSFFSHQEKLLKNLYHTTQKEITTLRLVLSPRTNQDQYHSTIHYNNYIINSGGNVDTLLDPHLPLHRALDERTRLSLENANVSQLSLTVNKKGQLISHVAPNSDRFGSSVMDVDGFNSSALSPLYRSGSQVITLANPVSPQQPDLGEKKGLVELQRSNTTAQDTSLSTLQYSFTPLDPQRYNSDQWKLYESIFYTNTSRLFRAHLRTLSEPIPVSSSSPSPASLLAAYYPPLHTPTPGQTSTPNPDFVTTQLLDKKQLQIDSPQAELSTPTPAGQFSPNYTHLDEVLTDMREEIDLSRISTDSGKNSAKSDLSKNTVETTSSKKQFTNPADGSKTWIVVATSQKDGSNQITESKTSFKTTVAVTTRDPITMTEHLNRRGNGNKGVGGIRCANGTNSTTVQSSQGKHSSQNDQKSNTQMANNSISRPSPGSLGSKEDQKRVPRNSQANITDSKTDQLNNGSNDPNTKQPEKSSDRSSGSSDTSTHNSHDKDDQHSSKSPQIDNHSLQIDSTDDTSHDHQEHFTPPLSPRSGSNQGDSNHSNGQHEHDQSDLPDHDSDNDNNNNNNNNNDTGNDPYDLHTHSDDHSSNDHEHGQGDNYDDDDLRESFTSFPRTDTTLFFDLKSITEDSHSSQNQKSPLTTLDEPDFSDDGDDDDGLKSSSNVVSSTTGKPKADQQDKGVSDGKPGSRRGSLDKKDAKFTTDSRKISQTSSRSLVDKNDEGADVKHIHGDEEGSFEEFDQNNDDFNADDDGDGDDTFDTEPMRPTLTPQNLQPTNAKIVTNVTSTSQIHSDSLVSADALLMPGKAVGDGPFSTLSVPSAPPANKKTVKSKGLRHDGLCTNMISTINESLLPLTQHIAKHGNRSLLLLLSHVVVALKYQSSVLHFQTDCYSAKVGEENSKYHGHVEKDKKHDKIDLLTAPTAPNLISRPSRYTFDATTTKLSLFSMFYGSSSSSSSFDDKHEEQRDRVKIDPTPSTTLHPLTHLLTPSLSHLSAPFTTPHNASTSSFLSSLSAVCTFPTLYNNLIDDLNAAESFVQNESIIASRALRNSIAQSQGINIKQIVPPIFSPSTMKNTIAQYSQQQAIVDRGKDNEHQNPLHHSQYHHGQGDHSHPGHHPHHSKSPQSTPSLGSNANQSKTNSTSATIGSSVTNSIPNIFENATYTSFPRDVLKAAQSAQNSGNFSALKSFYNWSNLPSLPSDSSTAPSVYSQYSQFTLNHGVAGSTGPHSSSVTQSPLSPQGSHHQNTPHFSQSLDIQPTFQPSSPFPALPSSPTQIVQFPTDSTPSPHPSFTNVLSDPTTSPLQSHNLQPTPTTSIPAKGHKDKEKDNEADITNAAFGSGLLSSFNPLVRSALSVVEDFFHYVNQPNLLMHDYLHHLVPDFLVIPTSSQAKSQTDMDAFVRSNEVVWNNLQCHLHQQTNTLNNHNENHSFDLKREDLVTEQFVQLYDANLALGNHFIYASLAQQQLNPWLGDDQVGTVIEDFTTSINNTNNINNPSNGFILNSKNHNNNRSFNLNSTPSPITPINSSTLHYNHQLNQLSPLSTSTNSTPSPFAMSPFFPHSQTSSNQNSTATPTTRSSHATHQIAPASQTPSTIATMTSLHSPHQHHYSLSVPKSRQCRLQPRQNQKIAKNRTCCDCETVGTNCACQCVLLPPVYLISRNLPYTTAPPLQKLQNQQNELSDAFWSATSLSATQTPTFPQAFPHVSQIDQLIKQTMPESLHQLIPALHSISQTVSTPLSEDQFLIMELLSCLKYYASKVDFLPVVKNMDKTAGNGGNQDLFEFSLYGIPINILWLLSLLLLIFSHVQQQHIGIEVDLGIALHWFQQYIPSVDFYMFYFHNIMALTSVQHDLDVKNAPQHLSTPSLAHLTNSTTFTPLDLILNHPPLKANFNFSLNCSLSLLEKTLLSDHHSTRPFLLHGLLDFQHTNSTQSHQLLASQPTNGTLSFLRYSNLEQQILVYEKTYESLLPTRQLVANLVKQRNDTNTMMTKLFANNVNAVVPRSLLPLQGLLSSNTNAVHAIMATYGQTDKIQSVSTTTRSSNPQPTSPLQPPLITLPIQEELELAIIKQQTLESEHIAAQLAQDNNINSNNLFHAISIRDWLIDNRPHLQPITTPPYLQNVNIEDIRLTPHHEQFLQSDAVFFNTDFYTKYGHYTPALDPSDPDSSFLTPQQTMENPLTMLSTKQKALRFRHLIKMATTTASLTTTLARFDPALLYKMLAYQWYRSRELLTKDVESKAIEAPMPTPLFPSTASTSTQSVSSMANKQGPGEQQSHSVASGSGQVSTGSGQVSTGSGHRSEKTTHHAFSLNFSAFNANTQPRRTKLGAIFGYKDENHYYKQFDVHCVHSGGFGDPASSATNDPTGSKIIIDSTPSTPPSNSIKSPSKSATKFPLSHETSLTSIDDKGNRTQVDSTTDLQHPTTNRPLKPKRKPVYDTFSHTYGLLSTNQSRVQRYLFMKKLLVSSIQTQHVLDSVFSSSYYQRFQRHQAQIAATRALFHSNKPISAFFPVLPAVLGRYLLTTYVNQVTLTTTIQKAIKLMNKRVNDMIQREFDNVDVILRSYISRDEIDAVDSNRKKNTDSISSHLNNAKNGILVVGDAYSSLDDDQATQPHRIHFANNVVTVYTKNSDGIEFTIAQSDDAGPIVNKIDQSDKENDRNVGKDSTSQIAPKSTKVVTKVPKYIGNKAIVNPISIVDEDDDFYYITAHVHPILPAEQGESNESRPPSTTVTESQPDGSDTYHHTTRHALQLQTDTDKVQQVNNTAEFQHPPKTKTQHQKRPKGTKFHPLPSIPLQANPKLSRGIQYKLDLKKFSYQPGEFDQTVNTAFALHDDPAKVTSLLNLTPLPTRPNKPIFYQPLHKFCRGVGENLSNLDSNCNQTSRTHSHHGQSDAASGKLDTRFVQGVNFSFAAAPQHSYMFEHSQTSDDDEDDGDQSDSQINSIDNETNGTVNKTINKVLPRQSSPFSKTKTCALDNNRDYSEQLAVGVARYRLIKQMQTQLLPSSIIKTQPIQKEPLQFSTISTRPSELPIVSHISATQHRDLILLNPDTFQPANNSPLLVPSPDSQMKTSTKTSDSTSRQTNKTGQKSSPSTISLELNSGPLHGGNSQRLTDYIDKRQLDDANHVGLYFSYTSLLSLHDGKTPSCLGAHGGEQDSHVDMMLPGGSSTTQNHSLNPPPISQLTFTPFSQATLEQSQEVIQNALQQRHMYDSALQKLKNELALRIASSQTKHDVSKPSSGLLSNSSQSTTDQINHSHTGIIAGPTQAHLSLPASQVPFTYQSLHNTSRGDTLWTHSLSSPTLLNNAKNTSNPHQLDSNSDIFDPSLLSDEQSSYFSPSVLDVGRLNEKTSLPQVSFPTAAQQRQFHISLTPPSTLLAVPPHSNHGASQNHDEHQHQQHLQPQHASPLSPFSIHSPTTTSISLYSRGEYANVSTNPIQTTIVNGRETLPALPAKKRSLFDFGTLSITNNPQSGNSTMPSAGSSSQAQNNNQQQMLQHPGFMYVNRAQFHGIGTNASLPAAGNVNATNITPNP